MNYLYVAKFSNGHVKVGRSIDPPSRIAQHEARVSCLGISVEDWHQVACTVDVVRAEKELIKWCDEYATDRFKSEWFAGLVFEDVVHTACSCATTRFEPTPQGEIQEITNWLVETGGLTQKQIAEKVGVSQATISDVATGQLGHTRPSYKLVSGLMALKQVREAELVAEAAKA